MDITNINTKDLNKVQLAAIAKLRGECCVNCISSIKLGGVISELMKKPATYICTWYPSHKLHKVQSDHWCEHYSLLGK